jgi:hypothetical protein
MMRSTISLISSLMAMFFIALSGMKARSASDQVRAEGLQWLGLGVQLLMFAVQEAIL